tara:strand:- start:6464 stop:6778 length:315 start_codon:yes stop_codon:yes gene_type:complete
VNYNNPHHDWDDYQDKITLTGAEEDHMEDLVDEMLQDDFQDVLFNATQCNEGYKHRAEDLKLILVGIHTNSGNSKGYEALGEYLYLLAYEYASQDVRDTFQRFE